MATTESKTFYPGAYASAYSSFNTITNASNPVGKGSSNTTSAYFSTIKTAGKTSYISWPFDVSAIPANATIDSVSCKMKGAYNMSAKETKMQLYSGNTPKGSAVTPSSYGGEAVNTLIPGSWTRDELSLCMLRISVTVSGAHALSTWFYGADLTVTYTYQSEKFMLKLGGSWTDVARVFKKVSGIWVEQTDLANVVDQTKRLVNGGEYVAQYPGYKELSYIESAGQSYIDLGFAPNQNTRLVLDIEVMSGGTTFLYGSRHNGSANTETRSFSMPQISGTSLRADYGSKETDIAVNPVQRLFIDANGNTVTVNGVSVAATAQTFQSSYNMFLLSVNTAGTAGPMTAAKIRPCKAYHNGELIRDLIPVESRAGVVGLLDTINYVFYQSATSTPFYAPDNAPTIITFYLDGVAYKAEYGMTWSEYVASSYNTAGFEVWYDTRINGPAGGSIGTSAGFVAPSDVIVNGQTYSY